MNEQVFLDTARLQGAQFYNEALASAICQSVCMVVFYTPTYFELNSTYCAREFKAMEEIEARRRQALGIAAGANGLIIPIIFRGWDIVPDEIKLTRQCYNFEQYNFTSRRRLSQQTEPRAVIRQIARYIFDRHRELVAAGVIPDGCQNYVLPAENAIRPWLTQLVTAQPQPAGNQFPRG